MRLGDWRFIGCPGALVLLTARRCGGVRRTAVVRGPWSGWSG